ncbi:hypothetical protein BB558_004493 [Smittium angustum]|uniref:Uncharacterized protein n=1 Tax=Smittium angustum TaxID=133377 RepID=A0A2U1J314_SMIAN|nr:hypothetical protein BB558_004493 [Smittium angustum]
MSTFNNFKSPSGTSFSSSDTFYSKNNRHYLNKPISPTVINSTMLNHAKKRFVFSLVLHSIVCTILSVFIAYISWTIATDPKSRHSTRVYIFLVVSSLFFITSGCLLVSYFRFKPQNNEIPNKPPKALASEGSFINNQTHISEFKNNKINIFKSLDETLGYGFNQSTDETKDNKRVYPKVPSFSKNQN